MSQSDSREALECADCFRVRRDGEICPRCGSSEVDVVDVGDVDERQWVEAY